MAVFNSKAKDFKEPKIKEYYDRQMYMQTLTCFDELNSELSIFIANKIELNPERKSKYNNGNQVKE